MMMVMMMMQLFHELRARDRLKEVIPLRSHLTSCDDNEKNAHHDFDDDHHGGDDDHHVDDFSINHVLIQKLERKKYQKAEQCTFLVSGIHNLLRINF